MGARLQRGCRVGLPVALLVVLLASVVDIGTRLPGAYSDKIEHALAFFALAALAGIGHAGASYLPRLFGALLAYGLLIECIQWLLPWREFSLLDWAADAAGILLWVLLAAWRARQPA